MHKSAALFLLGLLLEPTAVAQDFFSRWFNMVSRTQAEQPHWMNPLVTTSPRLNQTIRYDISHQNTAAGEVWMLGNTRTVEIIPARRIQLAIGIPAYFSHENPAIRDGFGDMNFQMKYRIAARNEEHGNYIVTAFLSGSIPTGSYRNGAPGATITPSLAAGKGWGHWDVQSTIGVTIPVDSVEELGHPVQFNTVLQYHFLKYLWPEIEANATFFNGGLRDGNKQLFLTPGLMLGRFPVHNRVRFLFGAGYQIAGTQFHTSNHNLVMTFRMPF